MRQATPEDAVPACTVLIESITKIYAPYYENDEEIISEWLANKTPENVGSWIESENAYCIVAETREGAIVGFTCMASGEILLNYVVS